MKKARLNGSVVDIKNINKIDKDSNFNCINKSCNCEVIVCAFDSDIETYFRAKYEHTNDCYFNKIGKTISETKIYTLNNSVRRLDNFEIYNLINDLEKNLDEEISTSIKFEDVVISNHNKDVIITNDRIYFVIFKPTKIMNNEESKGVIFGSIRDRRIIINLDYEIKNTEEKIKEGRMFLISKLVLSVNNPKIYLAFNVSKDNILRIR